jgi:hypothetical protein
MYRKYNQLGGTIEELRQKINQLISQPASTVRVLDPATEQNFRTAVARVEELNGVSQQINQELARNKVLIATMLGKLNNSDLKRIIEQTTNLGDIPASTTSNNFINQVDLLATSLDNYNRNRDDLTPLTQYLTNNFRPNELQPEQRLEMEELIVESMLSVVKAEQRNTVATALNQLENMNERVTTKLAEFAQEQAGNVVELLAEAPVPEPERLTQQGGSVVKLNLRRLII